MIANLSMMPRSHVHLLHLDANLVTDVRPTCHHAVLIHLTALLVITLIHANDLPGIWSTGVRDVPWFHPSQQDKSAPAGVPNSGATSQQNGGQPQQSQSQPWHGRRRSHASHSWRERYSQSFAPQPTRDQENQGPVSNDDVDAARAFYPFLGQGAGVGVIPEHEDETMLEPLPVSFTLERIQPPAAQTPLSRPRGNSGGRNGGSNPPYNHTMQDARTRDSRVRSEEEHVRRSNGRQLPQAPEPSVSPQRSRSRVQTAYSAGPSGSQSRDRPSRAGEPQIVPLELSQTPSKPQLQPQASSSSQVPRQTLQRQPPSDSLLFSGAHHSSNNTSAAAPSSFQRPQRAAAPPSSTRVLPDTSAFYGTHIQSVLRGREPETEGGPDTGDGRSMTPSTRVYASTPKPKSLSAAQAYAAQAQRRPSNDRNGSSGSRQ